MAFEFDDSDTEKEVIADGIRKLHDLVAPDAGEDVVAVQGFTPAKRMKYQDPLHVERLVRKLLGRGRLDDRLPFVCIMALTPTRILVYGTSTRTGRFALTRKYFEWQRSRVTTEHQSLSFVVQPSGARQGGSTHWHVIRLTMHTPEGLLTADLTPKPAAVKDLTEKFVSELLTPY